MVEPARTGPHVPDGILDVPPGKIAAIATYLQLTRAEFSQLPRPEPGPVSLHRLTGQVARYRALYDGVGRPWLWFSRSALPDRAMAAIIDDPRVEALAAMEGGRDIGLLELDFRRGLDCELAFLGLLPDAIGRGFGRRLVADAIRRAFARPITRLWLHTCTLDHPAALGVYMKAGLRPFRRAVEVADDPRLTGAMPPDAGAGMPIL